MATIVILAIIVVLTTMVVSGKNVIFANIVLSATIMRSYISFTLRRPKQHRPQAPEGPYLAQTVRFLPNFHERFRRNLKPQINIYQRQTLFLTLKNIPHQGSAKKSQSQSQVQKE